MHSNPAAAGRSRFNGLIANGWNTCDELFDLSRRPAGSAS